MPLILLVFVVVVVVLVTVMDRLTSAGNTASSPSSRGPSTRRYRYTPCGVVHVHSACPTRDVCLSIIYIPQTLCG